MMKHIKMIKDFVDFGKNPPTQDELNIFTKECEKEGLITGLIWALLFTTIGAAVGFYIHGWDVALALGSLSFIAFFVLFTMTSFGFDRKVSELRTQSAKFDVAKISRAVDNNPDIKAYVQKVSDLPRLLTYAEIELILKVADENKAAYDLASMVNQ